MDFGDKTIDLSAQSRVTKLNNVLTRTSTFPFSSPMLAVSDPFFRVCLSLSIHHILPYPRSSYPVISIELAEPSYTEAKARHLRSQQGLNTHLGNFEGVVHWSAATRASLAARTRLKMTYAFGCLHFSFPPLPSSQIGAQFHSRSRGSEIFDELKIYISSVQGQDIPVNPKARRSLTQKLVAV